MSDWTPNQIRELVEQSIKAERYLRDRLRTADRESFEDYKRTTGETLRLQGLEYERRLHALNNEADRLQDAIKITVSRDTWDGFTKEFKEFKERVNDDLSGRKMAVMIAGVVYSVILVTIMAIGVLVNYMR